MSKRNVELDRILWPKESLQRTLVRDFPGCKSALEAVQKLLATKQETKPAAQAIDLGECLRNAIKHVEVLSNSIDQALLDEETEAALTGMPLTTEAEMKAWVNAWALECEKLKW